MMIRGLDVDLNHCICTNVVRRALHSILRQINEFNTTSCCVQFFLWNLFVLYVIQLDDKRKNCCR